MFGGPTLSITTFSITTFGILAFSTAINKTTQHNPTHHNDGVLLCSVSFMLNVIMLCVAGKTLMLSVIILNVVMASAIVVSFIAPLPPPVFLEEPNVFIPKYHFYTIVLSKVSRNIC
jgi:hypothetical protein